MLRCFKKPLYVITNKPLSLQNWIYMHNPNIYVDFFAIPAISGHSGDLYSISTFHRPANEENSNLKKEKEKEKKSS